MAVVRISTAAVYIHTLNERRLPVGLQHHTTSYCSGFACFHQIFISRIAAYKFLLLSLSAIRQWISSPIKFMSNVQGDLESEATLMVHVFKKLD